MTREFEIRIRGKEDVTQTFDEIEQRGTSMGQKIEANWKKIGLASAAAGAGIEMMARKQMPLTAQTQRLGVSLGKTESEVRKLALGMTNVTFPIEDVLNLMEMGRQQGIKSADALESYARFWDMVGDATGECSIRLAESSSALRAVGIAAGQEGQALNAFGYITRETTGEVSEFLSFIERTGPELRKMGGTVDDAAAIMGALEHELGMTARTARTEFRRAVNEADGDMKVMLKTLGLSEEQLDKYRDAVSASSKVIEEQADIHADSYTVMQRLQHRVETLMYKYGGLLGGLQALTPILIGLGPLIKGISVAKGVLTAATKAHTAALIKEKVALAGTTTAKGAATAAAWPLVAAKVALIKVSGVLTGALLKVTGVFAGIGGTAAGVKAGLGGVAAAAGPVTAAVAAFVGQIMAAIKLWRDWEDLTDRMKIVWAALGGKFGGIILLIRHLRDNWENMAGSFRDGWESIQDAFHNGLQFIRNRVIQPFVAAWQRVGDFFTNLWDRVTNTFRRAWEGMLNVVRTAVNSIVGVMNAMVGGVESAINFVIRGINAFVGGVNRAIEVMNRLPGVNIPVAPAVTGVALPRIPTMDTGGVIKGPGIFGVGPQTVEVLRRYEGGQSAKVVNIDLHVGILEGDEMGLRRLVRLLKEIEGEEGRRNAFAQVNKGYHYGKSGL